MVSIYWVVLVVLLAIFISIVYGKWREEVYERRFSDDFKNKASGIRADAIKRSQSSIKGNYLEQFAPYFKDFPTDSGDITFLGKPIDYVAFTNLENEEDTEIILVEVKTGKSRLTKRQRKIKKAVEEGRIRWEEFRIKEDV